MSKIEISGFVLEDLLPHRGRMLLVSEILEVDSSKARTFCRVDPAWPLAYDQGVDPLILIELAAQTAGVCNGWDRIQTRGLDSDRMGWLVGVKKAEFFIESLPFGATIIASAENTYIFNNLREVSCELRMDDRVIGLATLQLFQAE